MEQKTPLAELAAAKSGLMAGKRGLIMGVANDHSIAWGIARMLAAHGAELAFTYQGEAQKKRLGPLAASIGSQIILPCDVESDEQLDAVFAQLKTQWGGLDFLVHSLAFSDAKELKGRYVDTSRANFARSLDISCFSFTAVAQRAAILMGSKGGAMVTLSYLGAQRVMPNYNVMGVAKAALEASVRYLAADLGPRQYPRQRHLWRDRCGPWRAAASAMPAWSLNGTRRTSPLQRSVELNHVGGAALYLLSDLSGGVTGEIHFVDAGFNVVGMPPTADLKGWSPPEKEQEQTHGGSP